MEVTIQRHWPHWAHDIGQRQKKTKQITRKTKKMSNTDPQKTGGEAMCW